MGKEIGSTGYEIRGFIETPRGKRTTPQRQEEIQDVMASSLGVARDKIEGGAAGIRVDRVTKRGSRVVRVKGPRTILDD